MVKFIRPSQAFLREELGYGALSLYDVDKNKRYSIIEDGVPSSGITQGYRVLVPMTIPVSQDPEVLESLAWNLLLSVANSEKGFNKGDESREFSDRDLELFGYVQRGDITLAVAEPEYLGRIPERDGLLGLLVFNHRAVIRID